MLLCNVHARDDGDRRDDSQRRVSIGTDGRNTTAMCDSQGVAGLSLIVQYFKHAANAPRLLASARNASVAEVLVNDDSHDVDWRRATAALHGSSTRLSTVTLSPNIHEIRAYNLLAGAASTSSPVLAFAQDDNLLSGDGWARRVLDLFEAYPTLGVIAGVPIGWRPLCKWACALNMTRGLAPRQRAPARHCT